MLAGAIVALALSLGWCGRGWFGAGDGAAEDDGAATPPATATETEEPTASRCRLRVDARGVFLDGERVAVSDAVDACAALGEADLVVTGDAVYGTVQSLEAALTEAGVRVYRARRGE